MASTEWAVARAELVSSGKLRAIEKVCQFIQTGGGSASRLAEELGLSRQELHMSGGQYLANFIYAAIECGVREKIERELAGGGEDV